jgi:hypothetical protein
MGGRGAIVGGTAVRVQIALLAVASSDSHKDMDESAWGRGRGLLLTEDALPRAIRICGFPGRREPAGGTRAGVDADLRTRFQPLQVPPLSARSPPFPRRPVYVDKSLTARYAPHCRPHKIGCTV